MHTDVDAHNTRNSVVPRAVFARGSADPDG